MIFVETGISLEYNILYVGSKKRQNVVIDRKR